MKIAMILAAGRGERLRPITDAIPKALCNVHGTPLIIHHIKKLAAAGFQRIIINHAHLGGKIRQVVGDGGSFGVEICYAPEPPGGLETGGGIVNALPLLGDAPFVTVNADIFTDYCFSHLSLPTSHFIHLVLVPTPSDKKQGDFGLLANRDVTNSLRDYTYSGIACYHPRVFQGKCVGRYSVTPIIRLLADEGGVSGEVFEGRWVDAGSVEKLRGI